MKLAAVSSKSQIGNVQQNLSTTKKWIEKLNQQGADFILFPELNLSGYTNYSAILNEVVKQKEVVFQELVIVSHQSKSAFAVGFPELEDGKYYISHFLFHQGKHIGTHRKTHLGPTEKETFTEGNEIEVFEVANLKIGMQLCFETHFPEISYAQAKQGANVLALAFASPREDAETKLERFKRFLPARAYDNACFVVACNLQQELEYSANFPGLSLIINPKGIVLQESISEDIDYKLSEVDVDQAEQVKQSRMGYFNKSKRENIFREFYAEDKFKEGRKQ